MSAAEQPALEVQEKYWNDKWDWSRTKYPHDWAWRRGDKILAYLRSLDLQDPEQVLHVSKAVRTLMIKSGKLEGRALRP